jgi:hypothetical protein
VFHASKFIPYHRDTIGNRNPSNPDPIEVEGHDEFKVEHIMDSCIQNGKVQYLVKWLRQDDSEITWEPLWHMKNAITLVKEFHEIHPDAPKPISWMNTNPKK